MNKNIHTEAGLLKALNEVSQGEEQGGDSGAYITHIMGDVIPAAWQALGVETNGYRPMAFQGNATFIYGITKHPPFTRELIDKLTKIAVGVIKLTVSQAKTSVVVKETPLSIIIVVHPDKTAKETIRYDLKWTGKGYRVTPSMPIDDFAMKLKIIGMDVDDIIEEMVEKNGTSFRIHLQDTIMVVSFIFKGSELFADMITGNDKKILDLIKHAWVSV